jgi:hypothetical protein
MIFFDQKKLVLTQASIYFLETPKNNKGYLVSELEAKDIFTRPKRIIQFFGKRITFNFKRLAG